MLHQSEKYINVIMQKYVDRCLHISVVCAKKNIVIYINVSFTEVLTSS